MRYELTDQVATSRPSAPERMMHAAAIEIARGRHPTDASVAWSRCNNHSGVPARASPNNTLEIVVGGEHGCNHYVAAIAGQMELCLRRWLPTAACLMQVTFIAGGLLVGGSRGFPAPGEADYWTPTRSSLLSRTIRSFARGSRRAGDNSKALKPLRRDT